MFFYVARFSTGLVFAVAAGLLCILSNLFATITLASEQTADTSSALPPNTTSDRSETSVTKPQPPDSLTTTPTSLVSRVVKWVEDHTTFVTLCFSVIAGVWTLFLYLRSQKRRPTSIDLTDKRNARQRYLQHVITAHKFLPVAGFETNLRVPIPLRKVYVTLLARMPELERVRGENKEKFAVFRKLRPAHSVTVQEALRFALNRQYDGLVILGQPGSGKTTLTKFFLLSFAMSKAKENLGLDDKLLPILLFLRYVDPQQTLVTNILSSLQIYELQLDGPFFLSHLHEGKAILLLDGLDEVPTEAKRQAVSRWIHEQVHLTFPHCPLIVTSRFSGYRGEAVLPGLYLRLEIQDYSVEQIHQFLQNWLTAVETHLHDDSKHWRTEAKNKAEDLYQRIETTPALRELAVNPLMLQIIALVHRDRGTLPERRVELYKECTDLLLERWDKAKGLDVLLSADEARQLLQPVALWMHLVENRRELGKQEILEFITPILPRIKPEVNCEELLQSWQERSGIFKGEGDTYFFHHLSFQEYLTAEEIRNIRQVEILVENFDKGWWREPTLLAMGLTNPPIFSEFMVALMNQSRADGASADFMLRCIDETLVKEEKPFVEALRSLPGSILEKRYYALLALQRLGTSAAKTAVREALQDNEQVIADMARTILAKWGETPIAEKIENARVFVKGRAVSLPARRFNSVEHNAEYVLIPGAIEPIVFESAGMPAPDYPIYFAKFPVTNQLYRRFIEYLSAASDEELLPRLPLARFADSLLERATEIEDFADYLGKNTKHWAKRLRSTYDNDRRFNG
ncbi:MAG TPA: NACHT domain-containing protein, partial [bacterium]